MLGLMATLGGGRILLHDAERPDSFALEEPGYPADGRRRQGPMSGILRGIALPPPTRPPVLRGGLDPISRPDAVSGWIAVLGDPAPRRALIRIGTAELPVLADRPRGDLAAKGVNGGAHGLALDLPAGLALAPGGEAVLLDAATGREVARRARPDVRPHKPYRDLQGFLRASMTAPLLLPPFAEEDKRAFAAMEGIADRLAARGRALEPAPLVSVVMAVFNREGIVAEAIGSVLRQSYGRLELIVVDDGSTDGTAAAVAAIADPRLRLLRLPANGGLAAARNAGLREARGEVVCYLDSDNLWDERHVAAQVGAFDLLPDADLIYSGLLLYDGADPALAGVRYGHFNRALLENRNYIDSNAISHRRAFLERLGGFDEELRRYVDHDLVLRASELGTVRSVPVLLVHYFRGKVANTITADPTLAASEAVLRRKLALRRERSLARLDARELARPVTVVIPNWEAAEDLRLCLDALARRDWGGRLGVVVVDNASSAPVRELLAARQAAGALDHVPLDANYGFTHAANLGILRARPGSDILLLNNDAIVLPGAIQALQEACLGREGIGMAVPRQILPAGTKTMRAHVPFASDKVDCDVNLSAVHRNIGRLPLFHDGGPVELSFAPFFAVYIRREVIDDVGLLDAQHGRHYRSDRIYCDLMRHLTDWRLLYVPQAQILHKLQRATDQLRAEGADDGRFDLMFRRNLWDPETAGRLGFRRAPWDL